MNNGEICLIQESFYKNNSIKEMNSKNSRLYLYLKIKYKNLYFLIPFESELFLKNQKAIYPLPTKHKPNAGINFEKVIIFETNQLIQPIKNPKIPKSQKKIIQNNNELNNITKKFERYINNFIKACNKNRETKEFEYKFSTLHHFKELLLKK